MFHNFRTVNCKKQSGSALVIAIFVIVIMTLIGSALIRMQNSTAEAVVYEVMGTRAYAAAQTGIQWQLTEIFPLNTLGTTKCDLEINEPDISEVEGLKGCKLKITCDDTVEHDDVQYYTIISTGSCEVADIKTSRTVEIEARSIN